MVGRQGAGQRLDLGGLHRAEHRGPPGPFREVEVGLVIGRELPVGTQVTPDNWATFVAGLVVTNDVSARDLQLPKTQFFESKSYPTFTPGGPALILLDENELKRFGDLRLRFWVNGETRQDTLVHPDMIYPPLEALQALSRFQRLDPGDLLLTGTPVGTALSAPPKPAQIISSLLPAAPNGSCSSNARTRTRSTCGAVISSRSPRHRRRGDRPRPATHRRHHGHTEAGRAPPTPTRSATPGL